MPIVLLFLVGTLLGMIAVAVALWRSGFPRPAAMLIGVFPIADMALDGVVPAWGPHLVLLAGFTWVASVLLRERRTASLSH
jgi:hypothetical protein